MALWFTRESVRAVDRAVINEFGIPGVVLMENAAQSLCRQALHMLAGGDGVVIVCGPGNNGGDGFALARLLHNAGRRVHLVTTRDVEDYDGDAGINARIAQRMGLTIEDASSAVPAAALLVDALFGTGLTAAARARERDLIEAMNAHPAPVLAVDLPSGLDCDKGEALGACVRAAHTVTFVGMKAGFANPASREYTGDISVGDIGAPRRLVERLGERRD